VVKKSPIEGHNTCVICENSISCNWTNAILLLFSNILKKLHLSSMCHMVQPKHNLALARTSQFIHDQIIVEQRGVAPILLASIAEALVRILMSHTPFLGNYSITSKSTCACKYNVALGWYRIQRLVCLCVHVRATARVCICMCSV